MSHGEILHHKPSEAKMHTALNRKRNATSPNEVRYDDQTIFILLALGHCSGDEESGRFAPIDELQEMFVAQKKRNRNPDISLIIR